MGSCRRCHSLGNGAVMLFILLLALASLEPAQAQVNCYSQRLCEGTPTVVSSIRECCLTSDGVTLAGGMTFEEGQACRTCVVFGWRNEFTFVASERGEAYSLVVGYLKGADRAPGNGRLRFNVDDTPGTAAEGASNDYRVSNTQNLDVRPTRDAQVQVTFRVDNVALEPDETLTLTLVPGNTLAMAGDSNVFLLETIQLTIQDSDVVSFQFTVPVYRIREEDGTVPVIVERTLRIATDMTLRITPVNFTEVNVTGFPFPDDFPDVPEFNPTRPIIATSFPEDLRDFDITPVEITFPRDEINTSEDRSAPIRVFDDEINEPLVEVFVVLLEVVSDVPLARVNLVPRNASLCRIVDNDPINIGFEFPRYDFMEQFRSFGVLASPVFLIKENNRESEQTFEVVVTAGPAQDPNVDDATPVEAATSNNPGDYRAPSPRTFIFEPNEDRIPVPFVLFDDLNPELLEGFLLSSSPSEQSPPFQSGANPTTTIAITDNDPLVIGFTETFTSVSEGVGQFELCLSVTVPEPQVELPANLFVFIELQTEDGTAVEIEDYVRIDDSTNPLNDFSNDLRLQCFDVTIQDDFQLELTERFSIAAFPSSPDDPVVVNPNVSVVEILDNDAPTVGVLISIFEDPITVREDAGSVTVRVMKVGALSPQQPVRVMFTTVDSAARAGQDYRATSTVITFGPEDTEITVTIPLVDDDVVEGQENFTGALSLVSPPPNVELARSEVQLIITDDDAITVQFSQSSYTVSEDEGKVVLMVQKVGSNAIPLEVSLTVISGSARRGIDFQIETLVVPSGGTQQLTVSVLIIDDGVAENTEFFEIAIVSSDQVNVGTPQRARVEITDNDVAELGFTRRSLRVLESDGTASVTVQLQTEVERTITLRLFTQDDEAIAPTDYTAVQRVITFDSSTTSATIPIRIVNDDFIEADEQFFVRLELVSPQSGVVISQRRTRIIIETDDECPGAGATVSEKPLLTTDPLAIGCVNICFPAFGQKEICPN